jgi:hypothetical protein
MENAVDESRAVFACFCDEITLTIIVGITQTIERMENSLRLGTWELEKFAMPWFGEGSGI